MKWFKHYSNSLESNYLRELKRQFGFEGLGRYWAFIEFLYLKWDPTAEPVFDIQREDLRALFGFRSWSNLETFMDYLANGPGPFADHSGTIRRPFADHSGNSPGILAERSGNVYEIKAPILLKLLHSDFKKTRRHQEQIPPKTKTKIKTKTETKTKTNNKNPDGFSADDLAELWNEQCGDLPKVTKLSPTRKRKAAARLKERGARQFWSETVTKARVIFENRPAGAWRFNFDALINEEKLTKLIEGDYDFLKTKDQPEKSNTERVEDWLNEMGGQDERAVN